MKQLADAIRVSTEFEPRVGTETTVVRFSLDAVTAALLRDRATVRELERGVMERVANAMVDTIMASASMQARIAALRAELPTRVEEALVAAITKAVLDGGDRADADR